jgi:DNA-binding SARP family transcriptional activator
VGTDGATTLAVRVLGGLAVDKNGAPLNVAGRRPRAMLAVLALSAGQPVPIETLADRIWGQERADNVRSRVHTVVRRLRATLGEEAIDTTRQGYVLRVDPDDVDALRFARQLDRSRGQHADAEALVRDALTLWQGTPFGEEDLSEWLNAEEARRLTERWLAATIDRIDFDVSAGRHAELVDELEQLTAAYPLREPLWTRLLDVLARAGRQAEALTAYEQLRARLADELGIDPGPELQRQFTDLLHGRGVGPADRGSWGDVPRHLPADAAGFTGRGDALSALDTLLDHVDEDGPVAIGVVHGLGGIGKTTLALHWAHRVAHRFPDGQLHVDLRGHGPDEPMEPTTALDILLQGLGIPESRIPTSVQARTALLRTTTSGRRLLIVLDNARDADQVRPLLPAVGVVLITSRAVLRGLAVRDGARLFKLDVLPERDAIALLRGRLTSRTSDEATLASLADLAGHLPLALTVAAERVNRRPDTSLAEQVTQLRDEWDRLDALGEPGDPLGDVRAVLSWSYRSLAPDAARQLRLLGLCPTSDFSVDVAAALAGAPVSSTRRVLDGLVDVSLLGVTAEGRYQVHDLVQAYAAEITREVDGDDDRATCVDRLYRWCVVTATDAAVVNHPQQVFHPVDRGGGIPERDFAGDPAAAIAWLTAETAFLQAVARAAADSHPWTTIGIAHMLWRQLVWRRPHDGLHVLLDLALDAARRLGEEGAQARALGLVGATHLVATEYDAAARALAMSVQILARDDDPAAQGPARMNLGNALRHLGQPARGAEQHQVALQARTELGDELGAANARNDLALDYLDLSMTERAVAMASEAVASYRGLDIPSALPRGLDTLGQARHAYGDFGGAAEALTEALQLVRQLGAPHYEAIILAHLARSLLAAGRHDDARTHARAAVAVMDDHELTDSYELTRSELLELLAQIRPAG